MVREEQNLVGQMTWTGKINIFIFIFIFIIIFFNV